MHISSIKSVHAHLYCSRFIDNILWGVMLQTKMHFDT